MSAIDVTYNLDLDKHGQFLGLLFNHVEDGVLKYCNREVSGVGLRELAIQVYEGEDERFITQARTTLEALGEQFNTDHASLKESSVEQFYEKRGGVLKEAECKIKAEYIRGLTSPPYIWDSNTGEVAGKYPLWVEKLVVPFVNQGSLEKNTTEEEVKAQLLELDNATMIKKNASPQGGGRGRSVLGEFSRRGIVVFTERSKRTQTENSEEYRDHYELLDQIMNVFFATTNAMASLRFYHKKKALSFRVKIRAPRTFVRRVQKLEQLEERLTVNTPRSSKKGDLCSGLREVSASSEIPPLAMPSGSGRGESTPRDRDAEITPRERAADFTPRTAQDVENSFQIMVEDLMSQLNSLNDVLKALKAKQIKELTPYMYSVIPNEVSKIQHNSLKGREISSTRNAFMEKEERRQAQMKEAGETDNLGEALEMLLQRLELEQIVEISLKILGCFSWS